VRSWAFYGGSNSPGFGGRGGYPVWYREQQLQRFNAGEAVEEIEAAGGGGRRRRRQRRRRRRGGDDADDAYGSSVLLSSDSLPTGGGATSAALSSSASLQDGTESQLMRTRATTS
jgi:hypothetical protein